MFNNLFIKGKTMKKAFLFLVGVVYIAILIILRKYPENHFYSFSLGILETLGVVFFMINIEKVALKK